jgi:hypothetical protein
MKSRFVSSLRTVDLRITRRDSRRRVLIDGRTAVNYTMVAPIHRALLGDERVEFYFIASEQPARAAAIYRAAGPDASIVTPARAAFMRFDAYVASDFLWAPLPRGARRVQMFHGVGGKYGFDAPAAALSAWDRLWFVNERRLRNCVAAGAVAADSPSIRLTGMPKVDVLVDGSISRDDVLRKHGLDPSLPTVLYAPTWSPASSLNVMGRELIDRLLRLPVNLIVKLHDRSCDPRPRYSGGRDWVAALRERLLVGRAVLASGADICPYLAAADVMVTDHSSAGFEYLLLDRPLIRIHLPELLRLANVHADYVQLLADASTSVTDAAQAARAVERALADPAERSSNRRTIAADLFYRAGTATARCVTVLYEEIELDPSIDIARALSAARPVRIATAAAFAGQSSARPESTACPQ